MNGETILGSPIIQTDLLAVIAFLLVTVPLSLRVFVWAYRRSQRLGTIGQH